MLNSIHVENQINYNAKLPNANNTKLENLHHDVVMVLDSLH